MAYKGDDLDLRTPHAAAADIAPPADPFPASPRARSSAGAARSAPIWVDETVLDCCNHAYDVAAAHRAAEVRVEHLVYALTRVDEAAEALELRGVRLASLRREAATTIATEIAAVQSSGKTNPRRAEAFEEVLRLAAAHAYRRQAPVGVTDVIHALLDSGVEFQGLLRLLSTAPRSVMTPSEATLDVDAIRDRIRNGSSAAHAQRHLAAELAGLQAAQAGSQHTRIDAIELSIRNLTTELANERKILSGVLQDLQRELMAQREDTSRLGSITPEKIQAVFGDRLQSLEQAFLSSRPSGLETAPLQDRLMHLERTLQSEIAVTRAAVETLTARPALDLSPLTLRLEAVEHALGIDRERTASGIQALSSALEALAATVAAAPGETATRHWVPLNERLDALSASHETHGTTVADGFAEAERRLAALDEALATHAARGADAEGLAAQERAALREQIQHLSETLGQQADSSREAFARLTESLTQDLSEVHDGLAQTHGNHTALATALDTQSDEIAQAFAALAARIESLETAAAKPVEMLQSLSATVEKMHRVTVEKYYRRNRFWYWLFGTDDWLAASWPSQSARIAEELRAIKH